jgi:hypothetical protein
MRQPFLDGRGLVRVPILRDNRVTVGRLGNAANGPARRVVDVKAMIIDLCRGQWRQEWQLQLNLWRREWSRSMVSNAMAMPGAFE